MRPKVAFVGSGPTAIYTLRALASDATEPFDLTIFEEQAYVGRGTPYRPGWNDPAMLSNIASVEIPPIEETLIDWLRRPPLEPQLELAGRTVPIVLRRMRHARRLTLRLAPDGSEVRITLPVEGAMRRALKTEQALAARKAQRKPRRPAPRSTPKSPAP